MQKSVDKNDTRLFKKEAFIKQMAYMKDLLQLDRLVLPLITSPVFSLIYTSVRSSRIFPVVHDWAKKSTQNSFEIVLTTDINQHRCILEAEKIKNLKFFLQKRPPFNFVRGLNLAAEKALGSIFVVISDDLVPPDRWDEKLLNLKPSNWPALEYVVWVNDGYQNKLTHAIVTRSRYNRFGYLYYPYYESMYCDTELATVACRDSAILDARHLLFQHNHPGCNRRPKDEVDNSHASKERHQDGRKLYNQRNSVGFPIDAGPKAEIRYAAYFQVIDDDFFLFEICKRLFEEGVNYFFFCVPIDYWTGEPCPSTNLERIANVASHLENLGAKAYIHQFQIPKLGQGGDRIKMETIVRNESLDWIRSFGFYNILVVDGDELWRKGALKEVDALVRDGHMAIGTRTIPVVGCPGYPVDEATDNAIIYLGGCIKFSRCRNPKVRCVQVSWPLIYHFSLTRTTPDAVREKVIRSGHYGDPKYDFDEWLKTTFPAIHPGLKRVHMYRDADIWPVVREWTKQDLNEIPTAMQSYLAIPMNLQGITTISIKTDELT